MLPALGIEKVLIGDEPRISSAAEGRLPTLPDSIFAASIIDLGSFESPAETASEVGDDAVVLGAGGSGDISGAGVGACPRVA